MQVDVARRAPALHRSAGVPGHDLGVVGDVLAVEGGLDEPALALPEVALAAQQPLAQQLLEPLHEDVLAEAAGLLDQDLLDERRVRKQHRVLAEEVELHLVPQARGALEVGQRIAQVMEEAPGDGEAAGPGDRWQARRGSSGLEGHGALME